jgi:hypothetical protein
VTTRKAAEPKADPDATGVPGIVWPKPTGPSDWPEYTAELSDDQVEGLRALAVPFDSSQVGLLPKPYSKDSTKGSCRECGGYHGLPAVHLSYVGHAVATARLLSVDPGWYWEPMALTPDGLPLFDSYGGLWIRLTVCGVSRLGYGDAGGKTGVNAVKEAIGDGIRNAAMRFGVALDLWAKQDLHSDEVERGRQPSPAEVEAAAAAVELSEAKRSAWAAWQQYSGGSNATLFREYYEQWKALPLEDATAEDFRGVIKALAEEAATTEGDPA